MDLKSVTKWVWSFIISNCGLLTLFTHKPTILAKKGTLKSMATRRSRIVVTTLRDIWNKAMVTQTVQPFSHRRWLLHTNRSVWYGDHQGDHYTADVHYSSTPSLPASLFNIELPSLRVWTPLSARSIACSIDPDTGACWLSGSKRIQIVVVEA